MKEISVCIVDDNRELRNALEEIISMSEGYLCIGTIGTAEDAINQLPILQPEVVLMDINLGTEQSGIDVVRVLKPQMPDTNFMMCTVYEEDDKIFQALSAGASGYILKKTDPARMLEAIRELYEGGAPMSSQIARKVVVAFRQQTVSNTEGENLDMLSNREKEILELLSRGLMYKEIASQLFLSPETVRKHVYHIYEKLHVNNRVAAVNKFYGR
ncbi:MAG: response regulator transcription factor [Chitinophagaceae bacterium]|jgi:DNA-binding NarL/FixJ family response regulator|nr:response regulator transcription factor [Chitinophagaceae bacterium]MBK9465189.1 response regulator transcription factor [Chitinophagaceae bacterium]MBK9660334.1 response regulator transcription factor [Chitinophagaceae bacterium]MBP6416895.1 response regulator transcription factor [Chitinophagaceae bacterium]